MNTFFSINIVELGLFFVGLSYVITFWKQGGNQASREVIDALKEQHGLNAKKISDLTHEVGVLTGTLTEKEERIKVLENLVQGRSPEQIQYMDDMRKFTSGVAIYMDKSSQVLTEISVSMHNLNNKNNEQAAIIHALYENAVVKSKELKELKGKVNDTPANT